jgi:uncharacterized protein
VSEQPLVCDTTIPLYLGRIGQIDLLPALFAPVCIMDDLQARQLAEAIGLKVTGTLGILLRAKQAGLIPTVKPLIDDLAAQGFRLRPELHRDVLELAGEIP